ncbi:unnamed protein product, partial [Strongylus vulgaris]
MLYVAKGFTLHVNIVPAILGLYCAKNSYFTNGYDLANPEIAPASLWNRKDIVEFKNTIKKEGSEGIIKVGHGETVTVRVPTHEEGTCLFWEFATDYYDIGFGVYFEWTIADSNQFWFLDFQVSQVSIHVSESDDEEEFDETNPEGVEG